MPALTSLLTILLFVSINQRVVDEDVDFNTQFMHATVKIAHEKSTATGFLLSPGKENTLVLITAAHVFHNTPGDVTTVFFRQKNAEGEFNKVPAKLELRANGKPLWVKHPTEDVAVIPITPPKAAAIPVLSTDLLADDGALTSHKVHPGLSLAFVGYPHREEGSSGGFPLLRNGPIASYPLLPTKKTKTFMISANVFEGDSGAPVYLARPNRTDPSKSDLRLIVGLLSGQRFLNEGMRMVYGTTTLRHRLGFAVVVHATFIKETIKLLPR